MSDRVRCKFVCIGVNREDPTVHATFNAVTATDDPESENSRFWRWTPNGRLDLYIDNPDASNDFKEGEEYYLDIQLIKAKKD